MQRYIWHSFVEDSKPKLIVKLQCWR